MIQVRAVIHNLDLCEFLSLEKSISETSLEELTILTNNPKKINIAPCNQNKLNS